MQRKTVFLALAVMSAVAGMMETEGRAATNAVVITSDFINRLMDEAQTNNPGQLAADSRAKAAAANVGSIRVWDDPMFMFGGNVFSPQGFSPIGAGAEMLRPLAVAVIGALFFSVPLSLIATPVIYYLLLRLRKKPVLEKPTPREVN